MIKRYFDMPDTQAPLDIPNLGVDIWGIRIGDDSELDQCGITYGQLDPYNSRLDGKNWGKSTLANNSVVQLESVLPNPSMHKVSVGRPLIRHIPRGNTTQLKLFSTRFSFTLPGVLRKTRLALEFLTEPSEAMWLPTCRAPFDADFTQELAIATTHTRNVVWSTYGRKYHTVEFRCESGDYAKTRYQLDGIRLYDLANGGSPGAASIVTPLVALTAFTGTDPSADMVVYEGEGDYDYLQLTLSASGALASATYVGGHARSEDQ